MDNFTYNYLNIGSNPSNRLGYVSDVVTASSFTDDIDGQNPAGNYSYDELGQLIYDQQELIASIEWRSGDKKIKTLTRTSNSGNKSDMEFVYNPMGQRILKIEKPRVNNVLQTRNWWKYTYYTYDANGQVMATYEVTLSTALNRAYLKDQNIYGASRIGMRNKYIALYENGTVPYTIPDVQQNTLGNIAYEITNYLGNVNVVISDRKLWVPATNAFKACTLSRTDYFPFGMEISSRTTVGTYRFGYNGMEQDPEAKGEGNSYTTEFRQYDPRIGRWLSLDPLMAQFPWQSPYCAFDNNPVFFTDPLGLKSQDNIHIWEDGAMSIEKTDDPTNTYYFHHCDGTTVILGDQLLKTNTGMVEMPQNTNFYKQVAYNDRKYLPNDAAAGFLAATYMFSKDNSRKVKINQFMTSDWTHSSHPSTKACIDVQYIGDDKTPLDVQPQSNHHNVNVMKSNELANRYREFGFNTDGPWSVISLDGDFTGPLLDNSAAAAKHHHHFHIQGWAPPDGSFKPIIGKVNSQLIKSSTLKPLTENVSQGMTNAEEITYIFNRMQQVGLDGLNCWEWARGASLGIWERMGVDTRKSSGCGKNQ